MSVEDVIKHFETSIHSGLSTKEAENRLAQFGSNEFEKKKGKSLLQKFLSQFKSFMIIVLLIAAAISGVVEYMQGEGFTDAIIILAIVIINAIIGVSQEAKAEQSLEALEKMSAPQCKVIRDGNVQVIESKYLVPGDVVVLDTGDSIPADLRLAEAINLKVQDAALTGESVPEEKFTEYIKEEVPLGDRDNLGFSSSTVTYGRGKGIVINTGMHTEVGKIATMIQSVPDFQTPLQEKLEKLGKNLGIAALIICAVVFGVGVIYGNPIIEMFMIAVSLAAAAIPEGLPVVSTIVLAVGVQRLAKKHAIVRTLPSVETLGSTTVICSDKTGTLTQNKMTVVRLYSDQETDDVTAMQDKKTTEEQEYLIRIAILANDAKLTEEKDSYKTTGDPTETALIDLGLKFSLNKNTLDTELPRVSEIPFDSERKLMTTVHQLPDGKYEVCTKGGLDELLSCCTSISNNGEVTVLTESKKEEIRKINTSLAENALRVLAMGYKTVDKVPDEITPATLEKGLVFVGMLGMIDPPRPEVKVAVEKCRQAGIKPVMITGDHKITAMAIAKALGIMQEDDIAITGSDVEKMTDADLLENVHKIAVYARVSPEHKVRIVKAFQRSGDVVAMTGDGVNDAPALKLADIGAAMGIVGTDVSKEAADIVLADDNFSTIVTAVEEGRRIYDNILKAIHFMLSTNIGEIVVLLVAALFNWATPLLPIHILWINLVTDSLPALALSVDPADPDAMSRKPTDPKQNIMNRKFSTRIILQGTMIGALSLLAFRIGIETSKAAGLSLDIQEATGRTMTFTTLAFAQLVHVFNVRSTYHSAFRNLFSNKHLLGAIAIVAGLMLIVLEVPALHDIFHLAPLTANQWYWAIGLSLAPLPIIEIAKGLMRMTSKRKS